MRRVHYNLSLAHTAIAFWAIYISADLVSFLFFWVIEPRLWHVGWDNPDVVQVRFLLKRAVLFGACAIYGFSRFQPRHPILHPSYLNWLQTTTWHHRLPLPLGSISLDWKSCVVIGIFAALAKYDLGINPLTVLVVFGIFYLGLATIALIATESIESIGLLVGFGGVVLIYPDPVGMIAILIAMYCIFYIGLLHSLRRFPWNADDPATKSIKRLDRNLGRPFRMLIAGRSMPEVKFKDALAAALVVGWWVFCAETQAMHNDRSPMDQTFYSMVVTGIGLAIARLMLYCIEFQPPISFFGRIFTGRLIIPGYDYVFLGPIAAALTPPFVDRFAEAMHAPPTIATALAVACGLLVALAAGPSRRHWDLTGQHRIMQFGQTRTSGRRQTAQYIKI